MRWQIQLVQKCPKPWLCFSFTGCDQVYFATIKKLTSIKKVEYTTQTTERFVYLLSRITKAFPQITKCGCKIDKGSKGRFSCRKAKLSRTELRTCNGDCVQKRCDQYYLNYKICSFSKSFLLLIYSSVTNGLEHFIN